nr:unnamed protein product [Spirometra erinaceieuropaei]
MQLRWRGHLVRMDDERLPKRLFYGDVAAGSRRQGGQIRRYKDTLKSSLRTVKTGAAIYEANRIAADKAKREARKSQLRPVHNAAAQPLPTCPRCQRTFRARIGLVGHLRINRASRTAPTIVPLQASCSSPPPTNSDNFSDPPLPSSSSSSYSSSTAPTTAAQATVPRATADTTTTTSPDPSDEDQDYTCPHCDHTFTSHIGLVDHLRIYRTETGEPVREAPTYTHRTRLHCPLLAPSGIAWVYSAKCASTRAELTATPTHPPHPAHPSRPVPPSLHGSARPSPPPPSPRPP